MEKILVPELFERASVDLVSLGLFSELTAKDAFFLLQIISEFQFCSLF
jgi:hypothetical protein